MFVRAGSAGRDSKAQALRRADARGAIAAWRERWPGAAAKIACLVLVLATVAAYSNTFRCPFLFDDKTDIVVSRSIRQLWPAWQLFLTHSDGKTWLHARPVVRVSFALNFATGGLETLHYHLTNLAIHILAGLTLFGIVRRTLCLPRLTERYGGGATPLAFLVAGIWMLHPLDTQAVTYVVQRYESLMGMFYFLSLYCAIRGATSPTPRPWMVACVAACLLALGCKEVAVSLPLMILLYDRAFLAGSFAEAWRRRRPLYLGLAGAWAAFAVLLLLSSGSRTHWAGLGLPASPADYAKTQFGVVLHYLRLSFWPDPLVLDYGWPLARSAEEILPAAAVVLGLLAVTAWALVRRPMWGALGAWFFLILAPTSSVLPISDVAFEHRVYLPLAAVVAAAVIACYELLKWLRARLRLSPGMSAALCILPALAVLCGWGGTTYLRNEVYESELSAWYDTIQKAPRNPRAYHNFAGALEREGRAADAIAHFRKALEINPRYAQAHNGLAVTLCCQGRVEEGITHFRQALEADPDYPDAAYNLAQVLCSQGKTAEAVANYERALECFPEHAEAQHNLAQILYGVGRFDEAIEHCQKAIQIDPSLVPSRFLLGNALYCKGKDQEAVGCWRQVLDARPDEVPLLNLLARTLATCPDGSVRNGAEAVRLAEQATRLSGGHVPELLDTLAAAYAEAGRFSDAIRAADHALQLAAAHGNTALAETLRGRLKLYQTGTAVRDSGPRVPPRGALGTPSSPPR